VRPFPEGCSTAVETAENESGGPAGGKNLNPTLWAAVLEIQQTLRFRQAHFFRCIGPFGPGSIGTTS
jgi:hypothetical protein